MLNRTVMFEDMIAANTKFILLLCMVFGNLMVDTTILKIIRKHLQTKIGEVWHNYINKVTQVILEKIFSYSPLDCITDVYLVEMKGSRHFISI